MPAYPGRIILQIGTTQTFNIFIFYVISFTALILVQGFFWVLIYPPFDHPHHLKSVVPPGVPPWAHDLNIFMPNIRQCHKL